MASSQLGSIETGADVKIFFQGKFEANPNTANHSNAINKGTLTVYKRENGKLIKDFSDDEFRKWQEQNFEARGWNLYGSHGFDILETTVTGAEIDYHNISDDKLLGKSVKLLGHELDGELTTPKMVDQGIHIITSQIFADKFVLGDEANNITLSNLSVGYFRTYNPKQILNVHPEFQDESGSGRFYFRCKPQDVAIKGSSSLVTSFQESVKNKASIVIWFSLFNTVHGPKGTAFNTPTPAYGTLQGYITTMNHPFKLEDRFLVPENSSLIPNCEGGTASICIDKAKKIITLDLMNAIPFAGRNDSQLQMKRSQILADNKEHGMNGKTKIESSDVPMLADRKSWSLSLQFLADDGKCTDLGPISISDNNCIINVQYKEDLDLPTGCFLITDNENKPVFKERDTNCYLEKPFMYMEHYDMDLSPDPCETKIHVFRRGVPTADHKMYMYPFLDLKQYPDNEFSSTEKSTWNEVSPIMLKFATYDESYPEGSVGWIKTDDNGTATISVIGTGSGNLIVTLRDRRYNKNKKHIAHTEYITDNWFSVRVLPYDKQLLKAPKEQRTTWDFVYSNIFRYYHLVHPFISEKVLALNSESTVKQNASMLTKRTSKENVNKSWFVPAARNTSDVKRTILHEFLTSSKGFPTDT